MIGYLPDEFGHIGQMPQILRESGIDRAVVWRGVPGAIDRTAFRWEAPDGSAVTCEFLVFGYFLGKDISRYETPARLARALRDKVGRVAPFLTSDRVLITVGNDHSGPDAGLPERLVATEPLLRDTTVRIGSLMDHLDEEPADDLPVWRGELRSAARAFLHPNVYSTRVHQKRERGRVEALIERYAEPLAALVPDFAWPAEALQQGWIRLLWNGAHDSACGCSHDDVARDVDARYAEVRGIREAIVSEALAAHAARVSESGALRFNPSPFERNDVPGLGWRVDPTSAEPRWAEVALSEASDGWVGVDDGITFTLLDEPDVGDLYNFSYAREDQRGEPPTSTQIRGDEIHATWEDLDVDMRVRRRADEDVYRLEGAIRNGRPDHRLRLCVRIGRRATGSLAGSPFELVERGLVSEGSEIEAPSPTWPARHVVLAGGTAAYHEGVFEYEVTGSELLVTLLRCVGTISRDRLATRAWAGGPDVPTPGAQMIGTTSFAIGLGANTSRDDLVPTWERFGLPILEAAAGGGGPLPREGSLLEIGGDAVLSSVRKKDPGVQVRLWNPRTDRAATATVDGRTVSLEPARIETVTLAR
jgi:Alpha mannosidase middle domain/Glycosyl hydrolases family 38 N-terminal domain